MVVLETMIAQDIRYLREYTEPHLAGADKEFNDVSLFGVNLNMFRLTVVIDGIDSFRSRDPKY